jgi:hypothetical protein
MVFNVTFNLLFFIFNKLIVVLRQVCGS